MRGGPRGRGNTILLQNMILDLYNGGVRRIESFSPQIGVDHTWQPVNKYVADELKPHDKACIWVRTYDPDALAHLVKTQHQVVEYTQEQQHNTRFQILMSIDDVADSPAFTRSSVLLHQMYIGGRQQLMSTITATQTFKARSPFVIHNTTDLCIYRLRHHAELYVLIE